MFIAQPPPANPTADLLMIPSKVDYMFGLPGQAVEVLLFDRVRRAATRSRAPTATGAAPPPLTPFLPRLTSASDPRL